MVDNVADYREQLRALLLNGDVAHREQGLELLRSVDKSVVEAVFEGWHFDKDRLRLPFLKHNQITEYVLMAFSGYGSDNSPSWVSDVRRLDLRAQFSLTSVEGLGNLVNLEELRLDSCLKLSSLAGLAPLRQLKHLRLVRCIALENLNGLEAVHSLETINLKRCVELTSIDALMDNPALQHIDLSGCDTLQSLDVLLSCPRLRTVDLKARAHSDSTTFKALQGGDDVQKLRERGVTVTRAK